MPRRHRLPRTPRLGGRLACRRCTTREIGRRSKAPAGALGGFRSRSGGMPLATTPDAVTANRIVVNLAHVHICTPCLGLTKEQGGRGKLQSAPWATPTGIVGLANLAPNDGRGEHLPGVRSEASKYRTMPIGKD